MIVDRNGGKEKWLINMNIFQMFTETMNIVKSGSYVIEGDAKLLELSMEEMSGAEVFTEERVHEICDNLSVREFYDGIVHVDNMDSFEAARQLDKEGSADDKVLVLNFANPVRPGGGVRRGAKAQEEDLCRKSSLLLSLESKDAYPYYQQHRARKSDFATDAMILSPNVEIIRDGKGNLLDKSCVVSVLTCAAPNIVNGMFMLNDMEYVQLLYRRIMGILKVAAYLGYRKLVLGAWGCGAFGNDAVTVAGLFREALLEKMDEVHCVRELFREICFAVLDHSTDQYNFSRFMARVDNLNSCNADQDTDAVKAKEKIRKNSKYRDKFRGCLIGGAVGDALGMPVEFMSEDTIFSRFGENGITDYSYDLETGFALISDDTQMTMFTANGILFGETRGMMRGYLLGPEWYIYYAYLDWLYTQDRSMKKTGCSWILKEADLYNRRAPGTTCLRALREGKIGTMESPVNDSKGCGGVMRVAPIGLYYDREEENNDFAVKLGAKAAAVTHGHPLGYLPAAALVYIINRVVYGTSKYRNMDDGLADLYGIVLESCYELQRIFGNSAYLENMTELIRKAVDLSGNDKDDLENIHELGEGWVAEEALAIAVYCSLRYRNDFSKAIIAAVNHKGDSDSTGAITGNIMGAMIGYEKIPEKWKRNLELRNTILTLADDLCDDCQMNEYSSYTDRAWIEKYIECMGFMT